MDDGQSSRKIARCIRYARWFEINHLVNDGWTIGRYYGERSGFDCYLMEWHHTDREPEGLEKNDDDQS